MPATRGNIRLRLDPEIAQALDRARATESVSRTSFARSALIKAIRAAGHLPMPDQTPVEAGR